MLQCFNNVQGLRESASSCMLVIITGSTPHHSCFSNFPKWPLPSLAGMSTFYPDSRHRTSVNPSSTAPRLSHVRGDGKREEEEEEKKKQVQEPVRAVNLWFPRLDCDLFHLGLFYEVFGLLYSLGFSTRVFQKYISEYIPMK